jgi:hypothetical protein
LKHHRPDAVLVTPVVDFNPEQVDLIKAALTLGIPCAHAVASWDNLTNKGLVQVHPDRMFLWNEAQREEAAELHGFPPERVVVTGAQLFDHWFERKASRDRRTFCEAVGLDPGKPFVLYTGSSVFIARQEAEFVAGWLGRLRASADPLLRDLGVLIRPHPGSAKYADQWRAPEIASHSRVAVFPKGGGYPVTDQAQADLFDSIFHAHAVMGVNTSVMLEAAVIGRRTFTVLDPAFADSQSGMLHFRHLQRPGCVTVAGSLDEHFDQLRQVLDGPPQPAPDAREFVHSFLRPRGIDRAANAVLVEAAQDLCKLKPAPLRLPWYARLVRGGLFLPACWLLVVNGGRTTKKWDAKYTFVRRVKSWIGIQLGLAERREAKRL